MKKYLIIASLTLVLFGCKKDDENNETPVQEPRVVFKFKMDPTQPRLDNFGNPSPIPDGNAAQNPEFQKISGHYVELSENANTWLGDGEVVYEGPETMAGGEEAIDFQQAVLAGDNEVFLSMPLSSVNPGIYEFLRVSLSYQKFKIDYQAAGFDLEGTISSFLGYNNYITNYQIEDETVEVNENKLQGYWGFETVGQVIEGQSPEGATTVVNPLFDTSPIPLGSCLVTGEFETPLMITGNETEDVVVVIALSTNGSFEWVDGNGDGIYQPDQNESVVDMGIRGMIPYVE
ncbi:MAG: hypothetical protein HRT74_09200 [Flavobacteriales bacterium]|nr:hypothetical protein [Flavobacteriales bacterium]